MIFFLHVTSVVPVTFNKNGLFFIEKKLQKNLIGSLDLNYIPIVFVLMAKVIAIDGRFIRV